MPVPLIASLIMQGLQANDQQAKQQQADAKGNMGDRILQGRKYRSDARDMINPRIGMAGMSLPGDAMTRQNGVFESILSKYGQGNQWRGLNAGGMQ